MELRAFAVSLIIYICYFAGLYLVLANVFSYLRGRLLLRRRLASSVRRVPGAAERYLSSLVFMATGKEGKGRALGTVCIFLFILSFSLAAVSFNIFFSLIAALLAASVPPVSLVSKIQNQRNRSSREGLAFVSALYRNYAVEKRNIFTALEKTAADASEYPVSGRQAYLLLLRLRTAAGSEDLRSAVKDFSSALGSGWGRAVSLAAESAYSGIDVSDALADILDRLRQAKKRQEERKRMNGEAARMTVFLVPILYLMSAAASVGYMGLSLREFLVNQFIDRTGLCFFLLILLLFMADRMLLLLVTERAADI